MARDAFDLAHEAVDFPASFAELIPEIAAHGNGVIMTMGKGGVGKTTVAAAIAVELARLGHPVHLTTTDPAAHLTMALEGGTPGLTVSRIDPAAETRAYTEEVLRESGEGLDEKGRALLKEDLRSPCTEEIAVFRAFAQMVDRGKSRICGDRHRSDRAHAFITRRCECLSSRCRTQLNLHS